ncbi:MAG: lipoxygenase family protein [Myxococcota bacterium]
MIDGLRYQLAAGLLRLADATGHLLLRRPKGFAPTGRCAVPSADPDPTGRSRGLERALRRYATTPATTRFRLSCALDHDTVAELPPDERYPWSMLASKLPVLGSVRLDVGSDRRIRRLAELDPLYALLPRPAAAAWWDDDAAFARQRLTGPNPMSLERVSLARVSLARVSSEAPEDGLSAALAATVTPGRPVFAVDHRALLRRVTPRPGTSLPPIRALFQEQGGTLVARAIAAETPRGELVARPGDPGWRLLRAWFQSADFWVHEVVVHYLWTHVIGEKLVLATRRRLSLRHPVHRLLGPHLAHTLQMNRNGVQRLMVDGGLFDTAFAAGPAGKAEAIRWGTAEWRFWRMVHPENVARRGLDALTDHPWRDDGQLVWDAVHAHTEAWVRWWYPTDAAVRGDPELRAWGDELGAQLGDRGLPDPTDRDTLALLLAAAMFDVIQHDLVNAPQYDHFGWPPNAPSQVWAAIPDDLRDAPDDPVSWLPDLGTCRSAALATYAFSRRFEPLGSGLSRWYPPEAHPLGRRFVAALRSVDRRVAERNRARPVPYRIAAPWALGNSVSA